MSKPIIPKIELTEEMADILLKGNFPDGPEFYGSIIEKYKRLWREKGYIKKTPLELAEQELIEWREAAWAEDYYIKHLECIKYCTNKINILADAIQYLKLQIEELNK